MPCENIPFCSALPDSSLLKKLPYVLSLRHWLLPSSLPEMSARLPAPLGLRLYPLAYPRRSFLQEVFLMPYNLSPWNF